MPYRTQKGWIGKCVGMNFCRSYQDAPVLLQYFTGEQPILNFDNQNDLGVQIDSSLKLHVRVIKISSKASNIHYVIFSKELLENSRFYECISFCTIGQSSTIPLWCGLQDIWAMLDY